MPTYQRRKCTFCEGEIQYLDYKNLKVLKRYMTQYKKIVPKYYSGNCLKHQKQLARAIKRARILALLPFTQ